MVHLSEMLNVLFLCALALKQTNAFLGFTKYRSLIFYEPPVEDNAQRGDQVTEHFITQRLDNFDQQNQRTFQMRYLKNAVHFKSGGPVFIVVGGEWQISPGHIRYGQHLYDIAAEFHGLLIYTEHRFYGKTRPTNTTSVENLKYLSVDQSLADLAHFITAITSDKELNATGGVVLVGGSYAGTMVAWFRQKYPHLARGAWASSAPVRAKLNFYEYTEQVGQSILKVGGEECYYKVEDIFQAVDDLITNDETNVLKELFKICDDFDPNEKYDIWNFLTALKDIFATIVQQHSRGYIESLCKLLVREVVNATSDLQNHELYTFAQLFKRFFLSQNESCVSVSYKADLKVLKSDDWSLPIRPWLYQTCSEYGWYQTTDSEAQPFGPTTPLQVYLKMCNDVFGEAFSNVTIRSNVKRVNVLYGALDPAVTNVYFTHGSVDPWHRMGILQNLNADSPSEVISGISHCRDLGSIDYKADSKQLVQSKVTIRNLIKKWLRL